MKLDRNDPEHGGMGKYALINMRRYRELRGDELDEAHALIDRLDKADREAGAA